MDTHRPTIRLDSMRNLLACLASAVFAFSAQATESTLSTTFQPLDGLGSGTIKIVQVTCHDWFGMSGQPTGIGLISAANIPPSNNPGEAKADLNLASACGLHYGCGDIDTALDLTLDATTFSVPERFGHSPENILRASLECLRRCLPEKLLKTALTLKSSEANKEWMEKVITEFNAHDRTKVFFTPAE